MGRPTSLLAHYPFPLALPAQTEARVTYMWAPSVIPFTHRSLLLPHAPSWERWTVCVTGGPQCSDLSPPLLRLNRRPTRHLLQPDEANPPPGSAHGMRVDRGSNPLVKLMLTCACGTITATGIAPRVSSTKTTRESRLGCCESTACGRLWGGFS